MNMKTRILLLLAIAVFYACNGGSTGADDEYIFIPSASPVAFNEEREEEPPIPLWPESYVEDLSKPKGEVSGWICETYAIDRKAPSKKVLESTSETQLVFGEDGRLSECNEKIFDAEGNLKKENRLKIQYASESKAGADNDIETTVYCEVDDQGRICQTRKPDGTIVKYEYGPTKDGSGPEGYLLSVHNTFLSEKYAYGEEYSDYTSWNKVIYIDWTSEKAGDLSVERFYDAWVRPDSHGKYVVSESVARLVYNIEVTNPFFDKQIDPTYVISPGFWYLGLQGRKSAFLLSKFGRGYLEEKEIYLMKDKEHHLIGMKLYRYFDDPTYNYESKYYFTYFSEPATFPELDLR